MPLTFEKSAVSMPLPSMNVPNVDASLGDLFHSDEPGKTICCGFFRLNAGEPLVYDYDYHEMKIIVEGRMTIADETGRVVEAQVGDVLYFAAGSRITFSTPSTGLGFFCGRREPGTA
ncbi:MAG: cupin domain-containing protein [Burkholderiaceae bacterium]